MSIPVEHVGQLSSKDLLGKAWNSTMTAVEAAEYVRQAVKPLLVITGVVVAAVDVPVGIVLGVG